MTISNGGRLEAVLSCGVAASALLISAAAAQETTIDTDTTTPVATGTTGDLTVTTDGTITLTDGVAVTVDADADLIMNGVITLDGEAENAAGIIVTGDRTGNVTVGGDISILSDVDNDTGEQPATFPSGRFGFLVADDARLTGDVTFGESSSVDVEAANGGGVVVLGELIGDLAVFADITATGNGTAGVRVSGPVSGDVTIGAVPSNVQNPQNIVARGIGADAVLVEGDVGGRLTVARGLRSLVYTTTLTGDGLNGEDDSDDQLDDVDEAALRAGSALRVTGDVAGGIVLAAPRGAVADDPATEDVNEAVGPRTGAVLETESPVAALYIGGGAQIGVSDDDPDTDDDESFGGYGLYSAATITAQGGRIGASSYGVLIEDAAVEGGMYTAGTVSTLAVGLDVDAVTVDFAEGASLGRVLNNGVIRASARSDTGDAVAFRDRSGTVTSFTNRGTIEATLVDFDDGDAMTDTDEAVPTGAAVAIDMSAGSAGADIISTGTIFGSVLSGGGDDRIEVDGSGRASNAFAGAIFGSVSTGSGDDSLVLTNGARLSGRTAADLTTSVSLGAGRDSVEVTGPNSLLIADVDFGSSAEGGTFAVMNGGRFSGSITGGAGVDLVIGDANSSVTLTGTGAMLGSFTTTPGAVTMDENGNAVVADPSVIAIAVGAGGTDIASFNVSGDVSIADDTQFRTLFQGAFAENISAPIITAGGTLDFDNDQDRLSAIGAVPYLFTQSLALSDDGQSVLLNLDRRSAADLGIADGLAVTYEPFIAALVAANDPITADDGVTVVEEADVAVGRAVFNLPNQERFLEAFEQFLPGPLDAPLTYARVQNDSVTSLVTQRVTNLREGTDRTKTAWLQEESYFINRSTDGLERGFDGGGFVIALGADTPVGPIDTVGIAASIASARYDEETGDDFPFDRLTYAGSIYAAESFGPLQVDGRVGYGASQSESQRNLNIVARDEDGMATGEGDVRRSAIGEWDGTQLSLYGRALYAGRAGKWDVQPFASVDWLKLEEDAYTETGNGSRTVALTVDEREAESLRGNVGLIVGREFKTQPSRFDTSIPATIAPRLTVAYSTELGDETVEGTYNFDGGEQFVLEQSVPGDAAIVGADIAYQNEYARLGVGASVTASEEIQIYMLRVGVGLKW